MRYLTADYIFPISQNPVKNGLLVLDDQGLVIDVPHDIQLLPADAKLESHRGIICPGFVNAHCHLELSFLKGLIPSGNGLAAFLKDLIPTRNAPESEINRAAIEADAEMVANGIVVVADISNSPDSISVKQNSRIHYHTFVEVYDLKPEKAWEAFENGKVIWQSFIDAGLSASIVPHAPYTVTAKLLKLIGDFAYIQDSVLSIHNQETEGENEMFLSGSGNFLQELIQVSGAFDQWKATGFRSLPSVFVHLPNCNKMQFVHNTFSTAEDVRWAHLYNLFVWWCLCPKANLFIENRIPDISMLMNEVAKITIGTDSYASNTSLSILDELKIIQQKYKTVSTNDLLKWASYNGAEFLGLQKQYGSIEKGKKPGINLIGNITTDDLLLTESSYVVPLI